MDRIETWTIIRVAFYGLCKTASQVSLVVKKPPATCWRCKRHGFDPSVRKIPWRKKRQSIPLFLPGKSHGQRSLVNYSPWDRRELDMTKATEHSHTQNCKSHLAAKNPSDTQAMSITLSHLHFATLRNLVT